jgi:DNA ligase D
MPDFIPPMLARAGGSPFDDPDWLFELKWDGYRVQAHVRDGVVRLWTRRRNDAALYFPELTGRPDWLDAREAIVDGEVVALDPEGRPSFELLQERAAERGSRAPRSGGASGAATTAGAARSSGATRAPIVFQVFDLLWLDGRSLLDLPLKARKARLREVVRDGPLVRYAAHIVGDGRAFFAAAAERGLEGVVAKRRDGRYTPGQRPDSWLKIKARREQEFVVVGWEPGQGSHRELGALLLGVHGKDGRLRFAGEVGSGIDGRTRSSLVSAFRSLARDEPAVEPPPPVRSARWLEPRIVVRVEFAEWTRDELIRQSTFKGIDPDADPAKVVHEPLGSALDGARRKARRGPTGNRASTDPRAPVTPVDRPRSTEPHVPDVPAPDAEAAAIDRASAEELAALDRLARQGHWQVGGHEVHLTNLDKMLFPDVGLTKRDLVRYYVTVAPVLLPYLRDRGLTLDRWPDGPAGPHFWNKEVPAYTPAWVERWRFEAAMASQSHTYIVADRAATLAFLANQAAIDLHPWTSTTSAPDRPSWALIDIDPGPRTTWPEVLALARLYRTALGHLGVRGYPKVTGKRGLHVYLPVEPRYSFRDTSAWVEQLSRAVGAQLPDLVSWEWSVAGREGRARLDYTQNAHNKTLAAPYAVRPTATASVSAPIRWEELDDPELRPDRWTIQTMADRIAEQGDLFAGALRFDQTLPPL